MSIQEETERLQQVLIVEDSPTDAQLTREALLTCLDESQLHHVVDGLEMMEFLNQEGRFANAPRPDLILLDLNMPRMDGREVLVKIKNDPALKLIPIIVLSTSAADDDITTAYELFANSYIIKPINFNEFAHVMQAVVDFWFKIASLPQSAEATVE